MTQTGRLADRTVASVGAGTRTSKFSRSSLLDCLIDNGEQARREVETECVGRLEVESQNVPIRVLDRQVSGFCTFEDAVHIACYPVPLLYVVLKVYPMRPAVFYKLR